ncbi:hypothetical protein [Aliivibrio fischeri]|uniref:Uncharacterized protein n=1 Tax=Aliivibrio fischeri TaxID=668 RepID=A0A510UJ45_ALIFS|nr:hypothetical protein [Aliivibrio fischeri]GEK14662.1 hypothetical protein AFI02nite_26980 [Aliivibrio fischeri]
MTTKIKRFLIATAILMNTQATFSAEEKVEQLGLFTNVGSACPFTIDQVYNAVEGEFVRARVKPSDNLLFNLNISVSCIAITNQAGNKTGYAVSYDIRYGTKMEGETNVLIETPQYGSMLVGGDGAGSSLFFINAIKNSTSSALTDFLKMTME